MLSQNQKKESENPPQERLNQERLPMHNIHKFPKNQPPSNFRQSPEHQLRRFVRKAIRNSKMTRGQKEITTSIVNLWFHHRNGPEGIIRPGRKRLARQAGVTIVTVSRSLSMLKTAGVLTATKNPKGGVRPTHYIVNLNNLMALCGARWADEFLRGAYKSQAEIIPLGEGK